MLFHTSASEGSGVDQAEKSVRTEGHQGAIRTDHDSPTGGPVRGVSEPSELLIVSSISSTIFSLTFSIILFFSFVANVSANYGP